MSGLVIFAHFQPCKLLRIRHRNLLAHLFAGTSIEVERAASATRTLPRRRQRPMGRPLLSRRMPCRSAFATWGETNGKGSIICKRISFVCWFCKGRLSSHPFCPSFCPCFFCPFLGQKESCHNTILLFAFFCHFMYQDLSIITIKSLFCLIFPRFGQMRTWPSWRG